MNASIIAHHFNLPEQVVENVLSSPIRDMQERDRYLAPSNGEQPEVRYPLYQRYTPKLQYWQQDSREAYVDYIDLVDPCEVVPSEPEDRIRLHPTFARYVGWYKAGFLPPYPAVFEQVYDGERKLIGANRRRILAAREADVTSLPVWLGRWNHETGLPLKYGDILDCCC